MYKIFRGFQLVEAYQDLKKARRLAENKTVGRGVKLAGHAYSTIMAGSTIIPTDTKKMAPNKSLTDRKSTRLNSSHLA